MKKLMVIVASIFAVLLVGCTQSLSNMKHDDMMKKNMKHDDMMKKNMKHDDMMKKNMKHDDMMKDSM